MEPSSHCYVVITQNKLIDSDIERLWMILFLIEILVIENMLFFFFFFLFPYPIGASIP